MLRRVVILMASWATVAMVAAPAHATFPGENGKLALVVYNSSGYYRIATVNPDGSAFTELTSPPETAQDPAWSADGRRIAFMAHAPTLHDDLFVMDADGDNRALVSARPLVPSAPAWSPDGAKFVLHQLDLWTISTDGDGLSHLFGDAGLNPSSDADWSPDDEWIAFTRGAVYTFCDEEGECNSGFVTDIWVVRPDGSDARQLTADGSNRRPSWSPDGERIIFVHSSRLEVMNADGTGRRVLATGVLDGVWSPDGEQIAFSNGKDVYVMGADGSSPARVLTGNYPSPLYTSLDWQAIPNRPPDCSTVAADPSVLWPPNHRLRPVRLSGATDPDGDGVSLSVTGVTQDEPVQKVLDALRTAGPDMVRLRAERRPNGDGRVYRVAFRATDDDGAECEGVTGVAVPRHRHRPAVDSAPLSFNSFGS